MNGSDFIEPPPGLIPAAPAEQPAETVRQAPRRVERALPTFTPPPHAMPPNTLPAAPRPGPPPAATPAAPPPAAPTPSAPTSSAPAQGRPAPPTGPVPVIGWRLVDRTGHGIEISSRTVLGRTPDVRRASGAVAAVVVDDPARTVSKTHALVEPDGRALLVTDLRSTNGVRVEYADGRVVDLPPGGAALVAPNDILLLGEFALLVTGTPRATV
ncbi:FHA domain-containing protein [Agromyces sp. LHK192]|uniref:FHA domain-containing protein n=1 Tax=Agromyces sp. LHK192 TaxID=2498704 RepID=UPI000FDAC051|nr:FHA domain-containing protein [Agromyces sp. LHK192]